MAALPWDWVLLALLLSDGGFLTTQAFDLGAPLTQTLMGLVPRALRPSECEKACSASFEAHLTYECFQGPLSEPHPLPFRQGLER